MSICIRITERGQRFSRIMGICLASHCAHLEMHIAFIDFEKHSTEEV
jgi:hypothetical protein